MTADGHVPPTADFGVPFYVADGWSASLEG